MNYLNMLVISFIKEAVNYPNDRVPNRLDYLAEHVFGFLIDDRDFARFLAQKAVTVSAVLNSDGVFNATADKENYNWFVLLFNMPFFYNHIEHGMQLRHMHWRDDTHQPFVIDSMGFWNGDDNLDEAMTFTTEQWERFIEDVVEFARPDMESISADSPEQAN